MAPPLLEQLQCAHFSTVLATSRDLHGAIQMELRIARLSVSARREDRQETSPHGGFFRIRGLFDGRFRLTTVALRCLRCFWNITEPNTAGLPALGGHPDRKSVV